MSIPMDAFFVPLFSVAIAEIGDKTQLLAILLAIRFQKPWVIITGILIATMFNHLAAAFLGEWIGDHITQRYFSLSLGIAFAAAALWALIPDKLAEANAIKTNNYSVLLTTIITFFLAEIGDKTQFVTAVLAAKYQALLPVVAGTTLGMLLVDIPAVLLSQKAAKYIATQKLRYIAAIIFAVFAGIEFYDYAKGL